MAFQRLEKTDITVINRMSQNDVSVFEKIIKIRKFIHVELSFLKWRMTKLGPTLSHQQFPINEILRFHWVPGFEAYH